MKAESTNQKTFELTDGSEKLGELSYDNLFSFNALIITAKEGNYELKPTGVFSSEISVTKNGEKVAILKMNWKGHVIMSFQNGEEFILKSTRVFFNKYVVENKDQQQLLLLDPNFNWSKFNYNYTISYDTKPQNILLVLLAIYAANYFIASMTTHIA